MKGLLGMSNRKKRDLVLARQDFQQARSRASLEQIMARLRGESAELLCYEDVQQILDEAGRKPQGLQEIPLKAIVGSVGRCSDFTRTFLPRRDDNIERWAGVEQAATGLARLPPIQVYQVDRAYFVLDGNHRVSVARRLGATHIAAYVIEVPSRVPLSPNTQPDELIIKIEQANFLKHTNLDRVRPDADVRVSVAGHFHKLQEHVEAHRYLMGLDLEREIPIAEAVAHWYDTVYMPVIEIVRQHTILADFPQRTEADLYLWISEHQRELEKSRGQAVEMQEAAHHFAARPTNRLAGWLRYLGRKLRRLRH
jgi:uncharacterized ParB-like nuclease family protein